LGCLLAANAGHAISAVLRLSPPPGNLMARMSRDLPKRPGGAGEATRGKIRRGIPIRIQSDPVTNWAALVGRRLDASPANPGPMPQQGREVARESPERQRRPVAKASGTSGWPGNDRLPTRACRIVAAEDMWLTSGQGGLAVACLSGNDPAETAGFATNSGHGGRYAPEADRESQRPQPAAWAPQGLRTWTRPVGPVRRRCLGRVPSEIGATGWLAPAGSGEPAA